MKYIKKSGQYKGSNVTFNPETVEAYSYGWWKFAGKTPTGKVIINFASYSVSTRKHQSKVFYLMEDLNIKSNIHLEYTQLSLSDGYIVVLRDEVKISKEKVEQYKAAIAKPRTQKKTNAQRLIEINSLYDHLNDLNNLLIELTTHDNYTKVLSKYNAA